MGKALFLTVFVLVFVNSAKAQNASEYWISAGSANSLFAIDAQSIDDPRPHELQAWVYLLLKKITVIDNLSISIIGNKYIIDCTSKNYRITETRAFDSNFLDLGGIHTSPEMSKPNFGTPYYLNIEMICQAPSKPIQAERIFHGRIDELAASVRMTFNTPDQ